MSYSSPVFKMFTYLTDLTYTKPNFELHRTAACKKVHGGGFVTSSAHPSGGGFVTSNAHPIGTGPCRRYALGHGRRERTYCHMKSPSRTGIHPTPVKHPSPAQS